MKGFALLFAVAAGALAQEQPPKPAPERPALNLKLDNPSSFATIAPREKEQAKSLPALGGDARRINDQPGTGSRPDPIPKDTAPTGK